MILKVEIVYEDEYFWAIDKPSGLVVHSDGRTEELSLVNWLGEHLNGEGWTEEKIEKQMDIGNPHTLDSGRYEKRWGIVNRLDRETSGLILIAKSEDAFVELQKQFLDRAILKEYVAILWGKLDLERLEKEGKLFKQGENLYKISEPISRHKKDPRIWVCGTGVGERNTKRDAETLIVIPTENNSDNNFTVLKLFPKTGRTHQLRLHSRFLGHPIVGDRKYGIEGIANEHGTQQIEELLKVLGAEDFEQDKNSRLMLHAKSLKLMHPHTNEILRIETKLPKDFLK